MIILPKILYTLRTLPILIPNSIFHRFHKQINNFIWQNKKPCLSLNLMTRHMRMGGLGLPKRNAYHFVTTLDQARHWWHNSGDKS